MKLSELARRLDLEHRGDDVEIESVAPLASAGARDLAFVVGESWLDRAGNAGALIVPPDLAERLARPVLLSRTPAVDLGRAGVALGLPQMRIQGIHPAAVVDETAELGEGVAVGPCAVIGPQVRMGRDTVVHAGAVIHERCIVGERCIIHSNAVIGTDGYGFEFAEGRHQRIPHLGIVRIGDDVEIGAGTTIDRARFDETRIGDGVKIDNLVHIAHNCQVGNHAMIMAQAGFAGSGEIGPYALIGGQVAMVPHGKIGAGARVVATSGIIDDVPPEGVVSGWWSHNHRDNLRELGAIRQLPAFMKEVRAFLRKHSDPS